MRRIAPPHIGHRSKSLAPKLSLGAPELVWSTVWFFCKRHNPIFKKFDRAKSVCSTEYTIDFIGSLEATKFGRTSVAARLELDRKKAKHVASFPSMDDEYFEWISLLRSVSEAEGNFCFVELGAGYGRWAARAALAARQKKIKTTSILMVEAEPTHAGWAYEHMENNGITDFSIINAAIGEAPGQRVFLVHTSKDPPNPKGWYGQSMHSEADISWHETAETYCGKPLLKNSEGWGGVVVDVITLEHILSPHRVVDLIDMDIQGAEDCVIKTGATLLDSKAKRIHVSTHSNAIEASIREIMKSLRWICEWDFPFYKTALTPYGKIFLRTVCRHGAIRVGDSGRV